MFSRFKVIDNPLFYEAKRHKKQESSLIIKGTVFSLRLTLLVTIGIGLGWAQGLVPSPTSLPLVPFETSLAVNIAQVVLLGLFLSWWLSMLPDIGKGSIVVVALASGAGMNWGSGADLVTGVILGVAVLIGLMVGWALTS
jgi:hypothetical protein